MAGLITIGILNQLLLYNLRAEPITSGEALVQATGESLANALVDNDLAAIQETLNSAVNTNPDVVYAFAFSAQTPIVHTFPDGFPADLFHVTPMTGEQLVSHKLLQTESGLVRDFGFHPLDGLPAEVHLGISQARIGAVQRQVTGFMVALTAVGCLAAAAFAYGFSRIATHPLAELTQRVQRLGKGHLDERIDLPPGDEVGDLAQAFNRMAADIQTAIQQLQTSEAGYRDLLTAASAVGEGIALICDAGEKEGQFLFVNEAFAQLAGFDPPDLLHINAASVLHPDSLPGVRAAWERIRQGQGQRPYEMTLVDRHGRSHILETAGTLIEYQGQPALVWFTRDISQRKAREDELRRRNRELTALNAVASATGELFRGEELLERALRQVLTALSLDVGWILLQDAEGQLHVAARAGIDAEPLSFNFPNCLCGQVLRSGQPVVVRTTDSGCLMRRTLGETAVLPACHATVPLRTRGNTLGILSVAADNPRLFTEAEMGLLTAVGQQIGVALDNARLWQELQRKEQIRSELLGRVISAQEEERQRIACELHDGIGQSLNALVFGLNTIATAMTAAPDTAPEMVERLKISASDTVKELQSIIYDLRPSLLDDLGLALALRWYARERLEPHQIAVTIAVPDEAMTNVIKHARATAVDIQLTLTPQQVCMEIVDDGVGFAWEAEKLGENGRQAWGLLGIQERASLLGGHLDIETMPGRGTHLRVTLPLKGEVT